MDFTKDSDLKIKGSFIMKSAGDFVMGLPNAFGRQDRDHAYLPLRSRQLFSRPTKDIKEE
ncbi:hypothetical protein ACVITL_001273 [Rhizobium pisi]